MTNIACKTSAKKMEVVSVTTSNSKVVTFVTTYSLLVNFLKHTPDQKIM